MLRINKTLTFITCCVVRCKQSYTLIVVGEMSFVVAAALHETFLAAPS
jgi:hypothetical protein